MSPSAGLEVIRRHQSRAPVLPYYLGLPPPVVLQSQHGKDIALCKGQFLRDLSSVRVHPARCCLLAIAHFPIERERLTIVQNNSSIPVIVLRLSKTLAPSPRLCSYRGCTSALIHALGSAARTAAVDTSSMNATTPINTTTSIDTTTSTHTAAPMYATTINTSFATFARCEVHGSFAPSGGRPIVV